MHDGLKYQDSNLILLLLQNCMCMYLLKFLHSVDSFCEEPAMHSGTLRAAHRFHSSCSEIFKCKCSADMSPVSQNREHCPFSHDSETSFCLLGDLFVSFIFG